MNTFACRTSVVLSLLFLSGSGVMALDEELRQHPETSVVQFYESNFEEVELLRNIALNQEGDSAVRIESFQELIDEYPEAAAIAARTLLSDADSGVAVEATVFLLNELTMAGHTHEGHDQLVPRLQYLADVHNKSYNALRQAVTDDRAQIRNMTAAFMASKSDQKALELISEATGEGLYTDQQAANLYSLATGEVGLQFMERYLGEGGNDAQEIAVRYAGFFPSYQDTIRTKYFLNEKAPTALRVAASKTLGKYDARFAEYALIAANSADVDPELYSSIVAGYVDTLRTGQMLSGSSARMIDAQLNRFSNTQKTVLTETIKQQLNTVSATLKGVYEAGE